MVKHNAIFAPTNMDPGRSFTGMSGTGSMADCGDAGRKGSVGMLQGSPLALYGFLKTTTG